MREGDSSRGGSRPLVSLGLKVSASERDRIAKAAAKEGLSVSEFTRRALQEQIGFADREAGTRRRRYAKAPQKGVGAPR